MKGTKIFTVLMISLMISSIFMPFAMAASDNTNSYKAPGQLKKAELAGNVLVTEDVDTMIVDIIEATDGKKKIYLKNDKHSIQEVKIKKKLLNDVLSDFDGQQIGVTHIGDDGRVFNYIVDVTDTDNQGFVTINMMFSENIINGATGSSQFTGQTTGDLSLQLGQLTDASSVDVELTHLASPSSLELGSGSSHKVPITISHTGALTAYQVEFKVPYVPGMKEDFSDVGFQDADGVEVPRWIESYTECQEAVIWINSDLLDGDTVLYMVYGGDVAFANDINDVMLLGSDWSEETTIDTDKWLVDGAPSVTDGILTLDNVAGITSKITFPTNVIMGCYMEYPSHDYPLFRFTEITDGTNANSNNEITVQGDINYHYIQSRKDGTWGIQNNYIDYSGYRKWELIRQSTTAAWHVDGVAIEDPRSSQIPTGSMYAQVHSGGTAATTINMEYIFIRQYTAVEPTYSIGTPEQISYMFTKKKTLTINNTGGSALTGYQHLETITYDSDMQDDMADIRFTETDGTIIPHYTESVTDSTSAEVWIKYDVGADTTKDIYMYYGNSEVSDGSCSPEEMFDFWFGADSTTELNEKYDITDTPTVMDGEVNLDGNDIIRTKATYGMGLIYETRAKATEQDFTLISVSGIEFGSTDATYPDDFDRFFIDIEDGNSNRNWVDNLDFRNTYYLYRIDRVSSSQTDVYQDGDLLYSETDSQYISTVDGIVTQKVWDSSQASTLTIDWTRIRQYVATEPSISFGSEAATTTSVSTSFEDYKTIWIKPTGTDLEDYQIEIDVTYESEMQAGFDDIRFVQGNRELSYWLQEKVDSTSAKFWIKVPYIDDEYGSAVTMMYGNADLVSESDGSSVFEFFDDFPGTTLNEDKWNEVEAGGSVTVSNSQVVVEHNGGQVETISTDQAFGTGFIAEGYGNTNNNIMWFGFSSYPSSSNWGLVYSDAVSGSDFKAQTNKAGTSRLLSINTRDTSDHTFEIKRVSTNNITYLIDNTNEVSETTTTYIPTIDLPISIRSFSAGNTLTFDWVRVRKYTETEPEYFIMDSVSSSTKYKEISIDPSTDGTLVHYQLFLDDIAYDSDMQIDFDDLRFTDEAGNPIPMFLDSKVDSTSADVYVKVPVIHGEHGAKIWMWYGDATAISASDAENIYISYFDGDSSGWTEVDPNGHITFQNDRLEFSGLLRTEDAYVCQAETISGDWIIESTAAITSITEAGHAFIGGGVSTVQDDLYAHSGDSIGFDAHWSAGGGHDTYIWEVDTGSKTSVTNTYSKPTPMYITAYRDGNTVNYKIYTDSDRTNLDCTISKTVSVDNFNYFYLLSSLNAGGTGVASGWIDDVKVIKYVANIPTYSTGSEQVPSGSGTSQADITVAVTGDSDDRTYNTSVPQSFTLTPTAEISTVEFTTISTSWTYNVTVYWSQNTTEYTEVVSDGYANMTIHFTPNMTSTGVNVTAPYSLIDMDNHAYIGNVTADIDGTPATNLTRLNSTVTIPVGSVTADQLYTINISVPYNPIVSLISPNETAQEYAFPPVAHDIDLDWSDTTGTYKYFVTQDEAGSVVLESATVDASNASVTLMEGEYYWYVRGYDTIFEEYSEKSEVRFLNITETYPYNNLTGVQGIVYQIIDSEYVPVTDATVNIWTDTWSDSLTTDTQGYYSSTTLNAGTTYYLQVVKTGFTDSTIEIVTPVADTMSIKNFAIEQEGTSGTTTQDVTFVVKSWWGTRYEDVTVTAYRGGITAAAGDTDSSGSVVFALTPVYEYTITAVDTTRGISKTVSLYPSDTYYVINVLPTGGTTEEDGEAISDNVRYGVYSQQINLSSGYINSSIKSMDGEQVDYTIKINDINDTTLYTFTGSTTNQVNTSQIVPTNESYYITMDMDHPDLSDTLHIRDYADWLWGIKEGFDFGWEDQWKYQVTGYILMLLVGGLFSRFNAHIGALSVAGVGMFNFWTGWYPYDTAGQIFANVGIMVVLLFLLRKQEGD